MSKRGRDHGSDPTRPEPRAHRDPKESSSGESPEHEHEHKHEHEHDQDERPDSPFRKILSDGLSGLLDSGSALRRGQEVVSEVAHGTKEEVVRRVSTEVRGFLDKIDLTDLMRQVLEGMVMEVKTEVRFKRAASGKLEPEFSPETKIRTHREPTPADTDTDEQAEGTQERADKPADDE